MKPVHLLAFAFLATTASTGLSAEAKKSGSFIAAVGGEESKVKKVAGKSTTGTFLGIEEGDYAHWKMKTADGEEVSYFILKPDASIEKVLANPSKFKGRKCRVLWKESVENLPEAGGKTKIQQIVSVEWL